MFKPKKYKLFNLIGIASFLITACISAESTPDAAELSRIETAVALTVTAQYVEPTLAAPTANVTQTAVQFVPTGTPLALAVIPTRTLNPTKSECAQASLVSETIPDGTIFKSGAKFTKTWEIKNTSNCSWTTAYKIVFWDGDVLGGAYVYNLPQAVDPGQTFPISLQLTAPTGDASYTSKWMLQTPDSVEFGVGEYSAPFYATIVVSSSTATSQYGITSVEYKMVRDPATGCPANINFTGYATVTSNGPVEFKYRWAQSDGHTVRYPEIVKMKAAGTVTLSNNWQLGRATTPGTRWMALEIGFSDGENYQYTTYPQLDFTNLCGS